MSDRPPPRKPPPLPLTPQRRPTLGDVRPRPDHPVGGKQPLVPRTRTQPPLVAPSRPESYRSHERRESGAPNRASRLLRVLLWGAGGMVALIAAAALALTIWSPVDLVRDQLIARIKAKTGRDLAVAGPTSLSFMPSLAIAMSNVSLSGPPGMAGGPTLKMRSLEAAVPLLPLLQRKVDVERLVLREPVIDLHVDARGRRSWDFAEVAAPPARVRYAQLAPRGTTMPRELQDFVKSANPDSREAQSSRGSLAALESLSLQDVRIVGGTIAYSDERTGYASEVQNVDARIGMANMASPLTATGSVALRGEPISFDLKLSSPKQVSEERPARLVLKIAGRPFELGYEGTVMLGRAPEAEGTIDFKAPSVAAVLALAGFRPAAAAATSPASLKGRLTANDQAVTIADGAIAIDGLNAQGTLTIEPRASRPYVRGNLQIAELDLNRWALPSATASAAVRPAAGAASPPAAPPKPAAAAPPPKSIEDLLREGQAGTRVQGYTKRHGWNDEPINAAALGAIDADLKIAAASLLYRDLHTGAVQARVLLKDRALAATFDDIQLYEGRGRGLLSIDGSVGVPMFGANFSIEGVAALPFLKDVGDFEWIAGRSRVNLALGGSGSTERQIVSSLNGKADLLVKDGALVGYNVQQMLNSIAQGKFGGLERSANARTEFSELAVSFDVQNGQASTNDVRLVSQSLRAGGAGIVNLPERTMDMLLRPKLVVGHAGGQGDSGLEVPVRLAGPWTKPAVSADLNAVLKNPDKAVDTIKRLGEEFQKQNPEAVSKAKDLLNRFLKR